MLCFQPYEYLQQNKHHKNFINLLQPRGSILRSGYRTCSVDFLGLLVIFKCVSPNQFILRSLDGKNNPFLIEEIRPKPAIVRNSKGSVTTLSE